MKHKGILVFILTSLMMVPAIHGSKFHLGFRAGLNASDMNIVEDEMKQDVSARNGVCLGGILEFRLAGHLLLHTGLTFIEKGGIYHMDDGNDLDIRGTLLNVPILLKYTFGKKVQPYIFAGPTLEFLLASRGRMTALGHDLEADYINSNHKTGISLTGGFGIAFPLKGMSILLEGRYDHGLTDFNKGGLAEYKDQDTVILIQDIDPDSQFKLRGVQISLGIMIPIGKSPVDGD